MNKLNQNKDGFSLVEMLISIAVTSILLLSLIILMGYSTNSMRNTQEKIDLQEQAKDAFNHISSYAMEASTVDWDDAKKVLSITRDVVDNSTLAKTVSKETYYYWQIGSKMYFSSKYALAKEAGEESHLDTFDPTFTADNNHLMAENVSAWQCEVKAPDPANDINDHIINVTLTMKKESTTFDCNREICWRNQ